MCVCVCVCVCVCACVRACVNACVLYMPCVSLDNEVYFIFHLYTILLYLPLVCFSIIILKDGLYIYI